MIRRQEGKGIAIQKRRWFKQKDGRNGLGYFQTGGDRPGMIHFIGSTHLQAPPEYVWKTHSMCVYMYAAHTHTHIYNMYIKMVYNIQSILDKFARAVLAEHLGGSVTVVSVFMFTQRSPCIHGLVSRFPIYQGASHIG